MFPMLTLYEFKDSDSDEWRKVSETLFLKNLADVFDPLTPLLAEMLQGREIITPEGTYRMKKSGNEGKDY
jgi:hypothetical protein